ncbi:MAG: hypothetical protein MH472_05485, partial [Bacteroidia bacterium]|nr:hypothetical protein [Bacteroidia bacterium]
MLTTKDGGKARQVENFEVLINLVTSLGASYNPIKDNLKLVNLQALHTDAAKVLNDWTVAHRNTERLASLRKDEVKNLGSLVTLIAREVKICGIKGEVLGDIKGAIRQFRGYKAKSATEAPSNAEATTSGESSKRGGFNHSVSRKYDAFQSLVELLENTPEYESNDPDLTIANLKAKSTYLDTLVSDYSLSLVNKEKQRVQ